MPRAFSQNLGSSQIGKCNLYVKIHAWLIKNVFPIPQRNTSFLSQIEMKFSLYLFNFIVPI